MPDEDIIRIAKFGDQDGYELNAIQAALQELEKRNLSDGSKIRLEQQVSDEIEFDKNLHEIPLEKKYWILFFLFGAIFNIISIVIIIGLFSRGYKKKAVDAIWAAIWGFVFVLGSAAISLIIGDIFFS